MPPVQRRRRDSPSPSPVESDDSDDPLDVIDEPAIPPPTSASRKSQPSSGASSGVVGHTPRSKQARSKSSSVSTSQPNKVLKSPRTHLGSAKRRRISTSDESTGPDVFSAPRAPRTGRTANVSKSHSHSPVKSHRAPKRTPTPPRIDPYDTLEADHGAISDSDLDVPVVVSPRKRLAARMIVSDDEEEAAKITTEVAATVESVGDGSEVVNTVETVAVTRPETESVQTETDYRSSTGTVQVDLPRSAEQDVTENTDPTEQDHEMADPDESGGHSAMVALVQDILAEGGKGRGDIEAQLGDGIKAESLGGVDRVSLPAQATVTQVESQGDGDLVSVKGVVEGAVPEEIPAISPTMRTYAASPDLRNDLAEAQDGMGRAEDRDEPRHDPSTEQNATMDMDEGISGAAASLPNNDLTLARDSIRRDDATTPTARFIDVPHDTHPQSPTRATPPVESATQPITDMNASTRVIDDVLKKLTPDMLQEPNTGVTSYPFYAPQTATTEAVPMEDKRDVEDTEARVGDPTALSAVDVEKVMHVDAKDSKKAKKSKSVHVGSSAPASTSTSKKKDSKSGKEKTQGTGPTSATAKPKSGKKGKVEDLKTKARSTSVSETSIRDASETPSVKGSVHGTDARAASNEGEDEEDDEDDDTIYCSCGKRDRADGNDDLVGCDSCDSWYHAGCAGLDAKELELIDTFICSSCEKFTTQRTTLFRHCIRDTCGERFSRRQSKYCSSLCAYKQAQSTLSTLPKKSLPQLSSSLAQFPSPPPDVRVVDHYSITQQTHTPTSTRKDILVDLHHRLASLRAELDLVSKRQSLVNVLVDRCDALPPISRSDAIDADAAAAMKKKKSKTKSGGAVDDRPCGWSAVLVWDDEAVQGWNGQVPPGVGVGEGEGMEVDVNVDESGEGGAAGAGEEWMWCERPRKRCDRHSGWQKMAMSAVEGQVADLNEQVDAILSRQNEIVVAREAQVRGKRVREDLHEKLALHVAKKVS